MNYTITPIGIAKTCFPEKFGIPRQSGLAPDALGEIELLPPFNDPNAFIGLAGCSHIWVQFIFHGNKATPWKPKVRPPRLGGNKSIGVFATRSPYRPNGIGLSAVKLERIEVRSNNTVLIISGHDFLNNTPIIDIKPYIGYADCIPSATNAIAGEPPKILAVEFSHVSELAIGQLQNHSKIELKTLICQVLQQDPRPQYQQPSADKTYAMHLLNLDIHWGYKRNEQEYLICVFKIVPLNDGDDG